MHTIMNIAGVLALSWGGTFSSPVQETPTVEPSHQESVRKDTNKSSPFQLAQWRGRGGYYGGYRPYRYGYYGYRPYNNYGYYGYRPYNYGYYGYRPYNYGYYYGYRPYGYGYSYGPRYYGGARYYYGYRPGYSYYY